MANGVALNGTDREDAQEAHPDWLSHQCNLSPAALSVLKAAGHLAVGQEPGARHIAKILFSQHPLGTRVAVATCCTDVWILRSDLDRCASLSTSEAAAKGISDDPVRFLKHAESHRTADGPIDIRDLFLALFTPELQLCPIFFHSGLELKDVQKHLPKALRAVSIYEAQKADSAQEEPSLSSNLLPELSKALRVNSSRYYGSDKPQQPQRQQQQVLSEVVNDSGSSTHTSSREVDVDTSKSSPWAREEMVAEMAEMAPRSLQAATKRDSSMLAQCGIDLVVQARKGGLDPVIGRDAEISRALRILSRRTKNNVCLVGEPGVGKTAIAEAIAQRIASGEVPPQLRQCQELWSLDIGALLAGTGLRGDFEERLRDVLAEIRSAKGAKMLFIDELHLVLGAGRSESNNIDAANLMKPMLARGEIRCIGATTSDDYKKLILAHDAAFERRFQVIEVLEPGLELASEMLRGLLPYYAAHHNVQLTPALAEAAVSLSHQRIQGRTLPDKAIDVLDEACCFAVEVGATEVTVAHLDAVVERWRESPWQKSATNAWHQRFTAWFKRPWSRL